jgi:hypothetical protein
VPKNRSSSKSWIVSSWYARPGSNEAARYGFRTAAISSGVSGANDPSAEWHLLLGVEERDRGGLRWPRPAVRSHDLERIAGSGERDRDPDVADVPLEPRRPDRSVTVPTGSPLDSASHLRDSSNGSASPSTSMPTSLRLTPLARMSSSAALPM